MTSSLGVFLSTVLIATSAACEAPPDLENDVPTADVAKSFGTALKTTSTLSSLTSMASGVGTAVSVANSVMTLMGADRFTQAVEEMNKKLDSLLEVTRELRDEMNANFDALENQVRTVVESEVGAFNAQIAGALVDLQVLQDDPGRRYHKADYERMNAILDTIIDNYDSVIGIRETYWNKPFEDMTFTASERLYLSSELMRYIVAQAVALNVQVAIAREFMLYGQDSDILESDGDHPLTYGERYAANYGQAIQRLQARVDLGLTHFANFLSLLEQEFSAVEEDLAFLNSVLRADYPYFPPTTTPSPLCLDLVHSHVSSHPEKYHGTVEDEDRNWVVDFYDSQDLSHCDVVQQGFWSDWGHGNEKVWHGYKTVELAEAGRSEFVAAKIAEAHNLFSEEENGLRKLATAWNKTATLSRCVADAVNESIDEEIIGNVPYEKVISLSCESYTNPVQSVAGLEALLGLEELNLQKNDIHDLSPLAPLAQGTRLRVLDLRSIHDYDDQGPLHLADELYCPIREFIERAQSEDDGLLFFADNPNPDFSVCP